MGSAVALSVVGMVLAGAAAFAVSQDRARDPRTVIALSLLVLATAAAIPFAWIATFGRP